MTNGERFKDLFGLYATEVWAMPEKDFLEWLNTLTTAVEPTKHGRWVRKESKQYYWFECSECGYPPPLDKFKREWFSGYCPNCGARMDGRENAVEEVNELREEIQERNKKAKRITADFQREMEVAWNRWEDSDDKSLQGMR